MEGLRDDLTQLKNNFMGDNYKAKFSTRTFNKLPYYGVSDRRDSNNTNTNTDTDTNTDDNTSSTSIGRP